MISDVIVYNHLFSNSTIEVVNGLLILIGGIAALHDDVAILTKVTAKKTADTAHYTLAISTPLLFDAVVGLSAGLAVFFAVNFIYKQVQKKRIPHED